MKIIFFEDPSAGNYYPLSLSRPAYMLLSGTSRLYEKWLSALKISQYSFNCRPYLASILARETGRVVNEIPNGECLFINPRFTPSGKLLDSLKRLKSNQALVAENTLFALRLGTAKTTHQQEILLHLFGINDFKLLEAEFKLIEVKARSFDYLWDLISNNAEIISGEFPNLKKLSKTNPRIPSSSAVVNRKNVIIGKNAKIAPGVIIDASHGPVIISSGSIIEPLTYIQGPAFIGPECRIVGGRIREGCSFGPVCRIGGEVEESIVLGFANKYHEGFLGHAYLGEWVNLGALTTNSDLKNNYGEIDVMVSDRQINSRQIKVGSFIGDHTKTGIGTMLNTGISLGFSCNLYGASLFAEKRIKSFSWGTPGQLVPYKLAKAIETAGKSMERRGARMTSLLEKLFADIHKTDSLA